MRLGVIGHVPHWTGASGEPLAYEPYVREMRIWADLFSEIHICSPKGDGPVQGNVASYDRANIRWHPVSYTLAPGRSGAIRRLFQLPGMTLAVLRTLRASEFVHLRSPGHFALVGAVLTRVMGRASITKWAGENASYQGERLTALIHRKIECARSRRNSVLVYGPAKYSHQISFIPALMTEQELAEARRLSSPKDWYAPWLILSVGRMVPEKGFDLALQGLAKLKQNRSDLNWRYVLVGDGQCRQNLLAQAKELGIADRVVFTGALSFGQVQERYAAAHLVIMPGVKEGWPKVIAEAWAHGAIPVAARGGIVPHILRDGNAGVIFEPNPPALAQALASLLANPALMQAMAAGTYRYCEELSLTQFKRRLEQVLIEKCGLK